jgi:CRP-like cAMP-binding protein
MTTMSCVGIEGISDADIIDQRISKGEGNDMQPLRIADAAPSLTSGAQATHNRLLAALPADEYQRIARDLVTRPLRLRQVLHKHGDKLTEVHFTGRGICSITNAMEDGGMVEVATVGNEGFIGIGAALGDSIASGEAFVQVQGDPAQVMSLDAFQREMDRRGAFYDLVSRYTQAFVGLVMQSVACNGLHSAEERCCRWLLMTHDRVEHDEFALTHEFMAMMLGVRRPTVTLVMAELTNAGIISHVRGRVRVVDRQGLEGASCECYKTVRALYDRLLPPPPR